MHSVLWLLIGFFQWFNFESGAFASSLVWSNSFNQQYQLAKNSLKRWKKGVFNNEKEIALLEGIERILDERGIYSKCFSSGDGFSKDSKELILNSVIGADCFAAAALIRGLENKYTDQILKIQLNPNENAQNYGLLQSHLGTLGKSVVTRDQKRRYVTIAANFRRSSYCLNQINPKVISVDFEHDDLRLAIAMLLGRRIHHFNLDHVAESRAVTWYWDFKKESCKIGNCCEGGECNDTQVFKLLLEQIRANLKMRIQLNEDCTRLGKVRI